MKWLLLFAIFAVCGLSVTSAKNHHSRSHHNHGLATSVVHDGSSPDEAESPLHHENADRMQADKEYRHEHPPGVEEKGLAPQQSNASASSALKRAKKVAPAELKNDDLHKDAQEHNVNKKQLEDKDGIPMEKEFLIHVTSNPLSTKKSKKQQQTKRRGVTPTPGDASRGAKDERGRKSPLDGPEAHHGKEGPTASTKKGTKAGAKNAKNHRYPKKYNGQKHNLKKSQRKDNQKKEKNNEKNKEKREKMIQKKERKEKKNKKVNPTERVMEEKI